MNRKQKKTLLLTLGLVVVLVALLLGVRACSAHQEEQEAQEAEQQRLESQVPTASDTFESITYDNGDVTLTFTHDEAGSWIWADDPEFPLDTSYLEDLSDLITALDPMQTITDGDTLESYGLDAPTGTITATAEDGTETVLLLGKELSDGSYYLKTGDSDTVYVVSSELHECISKGIYDMAILEDIPALTEDRLKSLTISGAQSVTFTVTQDDEDGAVWKSGDEDVTEQVEDLSSQLGVLSFTACIDYKPSDEAVSICGLDDPAAVLTATYLDDEGEEAQVTLTIGGETTDGTGRYARLNDSTTIYSIGSDAVSEILAVAQSGLDGLSE